MPNISNTVYNDLLQAKEQLAELQIKNMLAEPITVMLHDIGTLLANMPLSKWPTIAVIALEKMPPAAQYYYISRLPKESIL